MTTTTTTRTGFLHPFFYQISDLTVSDPGFSLRAWKRVYFKLPGMPVMSWRRVMYPVGR